MIDSFAFAFFALAVEPIFRGPILVKLTDWLDRMAVATTLCPFGHHRTSMVTRTDVSGSNFRTSTTEFGIRRAWSFRTLVKYDSFIDITVIYKIFKPFQCVLNESYKYKEVHRDSLARRGFGLLSIYSALHYRRSMK